MKFFAFFLCFFFSFFHLNAYQDQFKIPVTEHPVPRKGKPHIHWCTMCGADNRYQMLKETIQIIEPYFDEIHIIDNGSTDETPSLVNLSPKVTYKRIENWKQDWSKCYFESIRFVCKNEWFMFHDSDERPSAQLLKKLRSLTEWANHHHVNSFTVQSCHHTYDDHGTMSSNYKNVVQTLGHEKVNFLKRKDMDITAFGGHSGFHLLRPKTKRLRELDPECFYNHYKSLSSGRLSTFTHGFMYPSTFDGLKPHAADILAVREEMGINDIQQLFQMLYVKKIPQKIMDLVAKWENSNGEPRQIWELIVRDRCEFQLPTHCKEPCCAYSK